MMRKLLVIGNFFWKYNIRKIPGLINKLIRLLYGCDIPCTMNIPKSVYFAHEGLGCVINASSSLGENVIIYSHVIIGKHRGGAPVIGNGVVIGSGAILLGNIKVGNGARIGAGSIVMKDVPASTLVTCSLATVKNINH